MFIKMPKPVLTTNIVDLNDTADCSTHAESQATPISPMRLPVVEEEDGVECSSSQLSDAEDADWIPSGDDLLTGEIPCSNEGLQSDVTIRKAKLETAPDTDVATQDDATQYNTTLDNSSPLVATQEVARLDTDKRYKCPHCVYSTNRKYHLTRHWTTQHPGEMIKNPPRIQEPTAKPRTDKQIIRGKRYKCTECEYTTCRRIWLSRHKNWHSDERPFSCELCSYKGKRKDELSQHMKVHTNNRPFSCQLCIYKSNRKWSLNQHMRIHSNERPFSCEVCGMKCKQKRYLELHMRIHTGDKPYKCKLCDYASARSGLLQNHMKTHTGETLDCDQCNFKTKTKWNLISHMRTHTGDKPYKCTLCDYRSAHSMHLKNHMRKHTGETFDCDQCSYKTTNERSLLLHMRTHTGDKPYKCTLCDYRSARSTHFKNHMRKHTGETFDCDQCSYKTTDLSQRSLNSHMRTHLDFSNSFKKTLGRIPE